MIDAATNVMPRWKSAIGSGQSAILRTVPSRPELSIFIALLLVVNMPGFSSIWLRWLDFQPQLLAKGQAWRLVTHPFVHVTWYHFLLDGAAFVILYGSLMESSMLRRLGYTLASVAGSLLTSWATFPAESNATLCGLSGIAHGLMAVSALEVLTCQRPHSAEFRVALVSFGFLVGKACYEALAGRMLFSFLEFGLLGNPVAVSHAGGVAGAVLYFLCRKSAPRCPAARHMSPAPDQYSQLQCFTAR